MQRTAMQPRTITAARYAWLIERLGLNQSSAAYFLGISPRQSRRLIAGEYSVEPAAAMLLELMLEHGISVEEALRSIWSKPESRHGRVSRQNRKASARTL